MVGVGGGEATMQVNIADTLRYVGFLVVVSGACVYLVVPFLNSSALVVC